MTIFDRAYVRHQEVLREFVAGAKMRVRAENILRNRYGYTDEQLKVLLVGNLGRGVETYGSKPRLDAMSSLGHALKRAKQIQLERLLRRANVHE